MILTPPPDYPAFLEEHKSRTRVGADNTVIKTEIISPHRNPVADLITRLIGAIGTQRCGTNPEIIIIHNFREEKNMKQVLIRISPPVPLQGILSGGEVMRFINQAFS